MGFVELLKSAEKFFGTITTNNIIDKATRVKRIYYYPELVNN